MAAPVAVAVAAACVVIVGTSIWLFAVLKPTVIEFDLFCALVKAKLTRMRSPEANVPSEVADTLNVLVPVEQVWDAVAVEVD